MAKLNNKQQAIKKFSNMLKRFWLDEEWLRRQGKEYLKSAEEIARKDAASWARAYTTLVH